MCYPNVMHKLTTMLAWAKARGGTIDPQDLSKVSCINQYCYCDGETIATLLLVGMTSWGMGRAVKERRR